MRLDRDARSHSNETRNRQLSKRTIGSMRNRLIPRRCLPFALAARMHHLALIPYYTRKLALCGILSWVRYGAEFYMTGLAAQMQPRNGRVGAISDRDVSRNVHAGKCWHQTFALHMAYAKSFGHSQRPTSALAPRPNSSGMIPGRIVSVPELCGPHAQLSAWSPCPCEQRHAAQGTCGQLKPIGVL